MRPCPCHSDLFPGDRTGIAIVGGQELQVEYVDHAVVVQVRGRGRGAVVVHTNGQGVELIDDTIPIDITGG